MRFGLIHTPWNSVITVKERHKELQLVTWKHSSVLVKNVPEEIKNLKNIKNVAKIK